MTTIAYRDGVMASDSRLTDDDGEMVCSENCQKVWKLPDGSLFGSAGNDEAGYKLFNSLLGVDKTFPDLGDKSAEVQAIHVLTDGRIMYTDGFCWAPHPDPYIAIGSGSPYAYAVMDAGLTAIDGAKAGIRRDVCSGGRVQTVKLDK